jgi:hypothetical protein
MSDQVRADRGRDLHDGKIGLGTVAALVFKRGGMVETALGAEIGRPTAAFRQGDQLAERREGFGRQRLGEDRAWLLHLAQRQCMDGANSSTSPLWSDDARV